MIREGLDFPDPLPAIEAAVGFARYQRFVVAVGTTKLLEEATEKARKIHNKRRQAECLRVIATIQLARSQFNDARDNIAKAESLYSELSEILGLAHCFRISADISRDQHNLDDSARSYKKALTLYKKTQESVDDNITLGYEGAETRSEEIVRGRAHCIGRLGALEQAKHTNPGRSHARNLYEDALTLYGKIGDVLGEASCIKGLGDISMLSDMNKAKEFYERAKQLCGSVPFFRGQADCIYSIADIEFRTMKYDVAGVIYEEAYRLYERVDRAHGRANCIYSIGDIALMEGRYEMAQNNYDRALELYERFTDAVDYVGRANCLMGLSDVARLRQKVEAAAAFCKRAEDCARHLFPSFANPPFSIEHGAISGRWRR